MTLRATGDYADFLLPHLGNATHLLDVGCGNGALSAGLAAMCRRVTALDVSPDDFLMAAAATRHLDHLDFVQGTATQLPFPDCTFDAVLAHSVLESGTDPADLLVEARRVLRPGGWLGVASVEYGGLILAGPEAEVIRRSNGIREQLWLRSGADPFLGRELRRLVSEAGFVDVEATTKAFSYGHPLGSGPSLAAGRRSVATLNTWRRLSRPTSPRRRRWLRWLPHGRGGGSRLPPTRRSPGVGRTPGARRCHDARTAGTRPQCGMSGRLRPFD